MSKDSPQKPIKYKKPPIVERVVSVVGDVSAETFYAKFESWKELIRPQFPDYDPVKDWRLNVEMKEGVPVLTDAPPEVQIAHRFWHRSKEGKRFMSMRIFPNQLTLNLHPETRHPHGFDELYTNLQNWLPQWIGHFAVTGCAYVSLDYINLLSRTTTPKFIDRSSGAITVGGVLTVFTGPPSHYMGIIPPYDCQMGLMIDPARPATFTLRVQGLPPLDGGAAIRVDFHAEVAKPKPTMSATQVLTEAQFLHTVILEQFEALFTEQAKKTFEPE